MDFGKLALRHPNGTGWMMRIPSKSGNFILSVVAGEHLYSTPSKDVNPAEYSKVELAIFRNCPSMDWASYNEIKHLEHIIGLGEYAKWRYEHIDDEPESSIFDYVPVNKIRDIWEAM